MTRARSAAILIAAIAAIPRPAPAWAQEKMDLAGRWTLNRELSQFPPDAGFGMDLVSADGSSSDSPSAGRGRRGSSGGPGGLVAPLESEDDARRLQQLTAEVRNPSAQLLIADTPTAVTIANDRGPWRTFYPDGKAHVVQLEGVPVGVTAKREAGRLVVLYTVEAGRELRYTYSRVASPAELVVDVQFIERGGGDRIRRIYQPTSAAEMVAAASAAPAPAAPSPAAPTPASASAASTDRLQAQTFNQQPDVELKGLTNLGLVVEDLGPQAATCGLNQGTIETAVAKRLSDAGFKVLRNADEDTYVYISIITTSVPTGLCVSRYDAFLYTHTTAKLSFQNAPVLVQVSLLHKGGLAGGTPAAHADGVLRGVQDYVDQFSTRIRDANKK